MANNETLLVSLEAQHKEAALTLVSEQFVAGNVLQQAMNITAAEYRPHILSTIDNAVADGLSIVAVDSRTGELYGCLIAAGFRPVAADLAALPEKFRPVAAIIEELEARYTRCRNIVAGDYMLVDLAVVSSTARGLGIYSRLRNHAHVVGREQGFKYVIGELSSPATQHFCVVKSAQTVKAEIFFADFIFQGSRPFAKILNPPSIQLVESPL